MRNIRQTPVDELDASDLTDSVGQTFLGTPVAHSPSELVCIERTYNLYGCTSAIEFGTCQGGVSSLLCQLTIGNLLTIDNWSRQTEHFKRMLELYKAEYWELDIFKDPAALLERIKEHPTYKNNRVLFYLDNGEKPSELKMIAPIVRSDDVVMVHDQGREWNYIEHVHSESFPLELVHQKFLTAMKSTQAMFRVKGAEDPKEIPLP